MDWCASGKIVSELGWCWLLVGFGK